MDIIADTLGRIARLGQVGGVFSFLTDPLDQPLSRKRSEPRRVETRRGPVAVVADCSTQLVEQLGIDDGLGYFWHNRPDLQREALLKIAAHPGGSVTIAYNDQQTIVGYVTVTLPDADTRWGRDHIPGLYELGGIEVGRTWRGLRLSEALLQETFGRGAFENVIVIATGYRWCWDIESTGLTVRQYRDMLNGVFRRYGFEYYDTDEPNIAWYPDNALVARVGSKVASKLLSQFKGLLFELPGSEYASTEFLR